jgi:hypothetical protein
VCFSGFKIRRMLLIFENRVLADFCEERDSPPAGAKGLTEFVELNRSAGKDYGFVLWDGVERAFVEVQVSGD